MEIHVTKRLRNGVPSVEIRVGRIDMEDMALFRKYGVPTVDVPAVGSFEAQTVRIVPQTILFAEAKDAEMLELWKDDVVSKIRSSVESLRNKVDDVSGTEVFVI